MISAKQARERAQQTNCGMQYIDQLITDAAYNGEFHIRVPAISVPVVKLLKKEGYRVVKLPGRYVVRWDLSN